MCHRSHAAIMLDGEGAYGHEYKEESSALYRARRFIAIDKAVESRCDWASNKVPESPATQSQQREYPSPLGDDLSTSTGKRFVDSEASFHDA